MAIKYMIDTSIWIDALEERIGFGGEPLGEYAETFLAKVIACKETIVISEILMIELERRYALEQIRGIFTPFKNIEKIMSTEHENKEAQMLAAERGIPLGDTIQAVLARNHNFVIITRDKHFKMLGDISPHFLPEDLL